mmetsp:Transcript_70882/g.153960  ORF Transcript_70882/g.153960 Transcript_70882/m.153960 type:complete len:793 (+) Transcript_70882:74-2452(+)|eukprot:CAMPEP_0170596428 /NCGR_PEP_ID=MMETSP0224-20130122/15113_1 /TAXON_ID=285029 /ORGANISM="Togula jolla, Strain CCCM 725" /LENGTH=792 /DNA_ID=CAMNT_0010920721 /DNA_START=56 /DNA_END=2434 /DNA_ORIENTATION=-
MAPFDAEVQSAAVCAIVAADSQSRQRKGDRFFGFAIFYEEQRALRICEYHEDAQFSRTEALLLQVQPRSCCSALSESDDVKKLAGVAESCGVELAKIQAQDLKQVDLEQDLLRLLNDTEGCGLGRHLEEQRQKIAMRALAALLAHWPLLAEPANFGACSLGLHPLRSLMFLDKAAFAALNVLPRQHEGLRSSTSLLGFLNRCRTSIGTRRLRQWLTQPLTSPEQIARRHDVVEAFCGAEGLLRQMEGNFRDVPDLERLAARLHRTTTKSTGLKATLEDLVSLYQCVLGAERILALLQTYDGAHSASVISGICGPLQSCITDFANFKALVEQTIDLKQADQRNYCINSSFDRSLQELAAQRDQVRAQMEAVQKSVDIDLGIATRAGERVVTLTECPEGKALRVTKKHQQAVQNAGGGAKGRSGKYRALSIKKNEFIFTTPELEKLNHRLSQAVAAYEKQSSQLVAKAMSVAATYCPVVERLSDTIASLDVLAAFSRVVLTAPCTFVRAEADPDGKGFEVQGATHILVIANSDKGFVANDLKMHRETSRLQLITGPNMGGKSTYIRSIALIALLNQIGSFVPCQRAVLPVFDAIMCRVGASDMQLRGISTFMAEMLEAACILGTATDRTLVVVDELGRGTSTSDGFGIAWAIARHLAEETRCFSLFATHFHELAALETAAPGVRNRHATAAVDAASGKLTFLYALADGPADRSYGAHCAELAGFPGHVVSAARRRAAEFEAGGAFGAAAKRQRSEGGEQDDPVSFILEASSEEDFVQRTQQQLAKLRGIACGGP